MKRWIVTGVFLLASWTVQAQNFAPGITEIDAGVGTMRVNSGLVGNFNAHNFRVYSFQMKAHGPEQQWNQVPLVETGHPQLEFILTTAATADFATRDASIRREGADLILTVAQLKFEESPYDRDAWVELRRYELRHMDEENRWIFNQLDVKRAPPGTTVDGFVASGPKP